MIKLITLFLSIILLISLHGCSNIGNISQEELQEITAKGEKSKIIVVDVFHNSCGSCKLIDPVMEKLISENVNNPDILFLKYDLSNPFTTIRSIKIAKSLGLEDIYKAQRFSGIVLFIDSKTKEVFDTLVAEYNIEKYNEVIQKSLKK